jgi:hypothetical protein
MNAHQLHNQECRAHISDELWKKIVNNAETNINVESFVQDFVCVECGKNLTFSNLKFQHWDILNAKCFKCQWQ